MVEIFSNKTFVLLLAKLCLSGFLAILFLQSGFDKVVDWAGNLDYTKSQFEKTFLKPFTPMMLGMLTLLEVGSGGLCLLGFAELLLTQEGQFALLGYLASAGSFLALLFGQRLAKDYAGAAVLPAYFLVAIVGILTYAI